MRLFDWFIRHLYWVFPTAYLGVWMCAGLFDPNPVEDQVLKQRVVAAIAPAADRAVGDSLRVDMARVAPFAWDTLYVFSGAGTVETIAQATGLAWRGNENVDEDDNLLVFVRRGHLAGLVEFRGFNYQQEPHFVKFYGHLAMGELFTPATASFQAVRNVAKQANGEPGRFIELHPSSRTAPVYRPEYARHLAQIKQAIKDGTPWPVWPVE
jgi:hypothetical protein